MSTKPRRRGRPFTEPEPISRRVVVLMPESMHTKISEYAPNSIGKYIRRLILDDIKHRSRIFR